MQNAQPKITLMPLLHQGSMWIGIRFSLKTTLADELPVSRIKSYLQYCFEKLKLSENTLHSRINALKFYYEQVLKKEKFFWDVPRPKKASAIA